MSRENVQEQLIGVERAGYHPEITEDGSLLVNFYSLASPRQLADSWQISCAPIADDDTVAAYAIATAFCDALNTGTDLQLLRDICEQLLERVLHENRLSILPPFTRQMLVERNEVKRHYYFVDPSTDNVLVIAPMDSAVLFEATNWESSKGVRRVTYRRKPATD